MEDYWGGDLMISNGEYLTLITLLLSSVGPAAPWHCSTPPASPRLPLRAPVKPQYHSMCKVWLGNDWSHFSHWETYHQEHSWDCVLAQRPVRLGFMSHPAGSEKVLGKVSRLSSLCLSSCCLATNTRLFGCVRPCCWGRVSLSDSLCVETCCGGSGTRTTVSLLLSHPGSLISSQEKLRCIEEEEGEVLGFIQHSPFLSVTKKVLSPVRKAEQLCNNSCCLLDNMMIFQADNWTALRNVRLRKYWILRDYFNLESCYHNPPSLCWGQVFSDVEIINDCID